MNKNNIVLKKLRASFVKSIQLIDEALTGEPTGGPSDVQEGPPVNKPPKARVKQQKSEDDTPLLFVDIDDPDWPLALPESTIVRNDIQKWARANTVLTKFDKMDGPVLDFGCGEGHISIAMSDRELKVVGYDIKDNNIWNEIKNSDTIFTTVWDEVKKLGPYKSVLLHDVIDHIENSTIEEVLDNISNIISDDGRIYVMAHPFSSRHGGHLYETANMAYLHLLIGDSEIDIEYPNAPPNQRIIKPQGQYQKYFTNKFKIINKKVVQQRVEPWIINNLLPEIQRVWFPTLDNYKIEKIMEIGGIYYTLEKLSNSI